MLVFLLWASLFLSSLQEQNGQDAPGVLLSGPQNVSVDYDLKDQRISVTWEDDPSSSRVPDKLIYDVEVLLTVSMTEVHSEAVDVRPALTSRKYHWSWTSALPLECTSRSVRLRSRYQNYTSQWSPLQTITGRASSHPQVFPRSSVVQVDSNFTFCCVLGPGQRLEYMKYNNILMNTTHIIDQSYAMVVHMQSPSPPSCINVYCNSPLYGTCVYVGYPPGDRNLVCETRDLESVECHWDIGRATNLTKQRMTRYHLNGRACPNRTVSNCYQTVRVDQGERNWTLTARNPLGTLELTDTADLKKRVRLLAPMEVVASGGNASVQWKWERPQYHIQLMVCQVQLNHSGHTDLRNYSGIGLTSVVLHGLAPAQTYTVRVCCGLKQHFWKWGDWSKSSTFKTEEDIPEALDVWMQIEGNQTIILWKPLTVNQSHGQIKDYEVTWGRQETIVHPPQNYFLISDRSTDEWHRVTVKAKNSAGSSPLSIIIIPMLPHRSKSSMKIVGSDGGFDLSWSASPNASCGYVVDWYNTSCTQDCNVEWTRVAADNTNTMVQSGNFFAGVRYTFSLYACSSESTVLLERWHGYMQELVPSRTVPRLSPNQEGSDVQLTWDQIPLEHQRGFILGYTVYLTNASHLTLLANITDPQFTNHTVRNLVLGSYKFTVKAYTAAGEDGGAIVSISLEPYTYWLIMEILVALGAMTCLLIVITIACYRKRKWVKKAFYPEIPEPKLPGEWGITQGTLDVKPSPHSMVHIVEDSVWDSSKEALVTVPEEDEEGTGDEAADTDEPASLRYYNQVVEEGSSSQRRPHASDSSASSTGSMDSGHTDVTYTGIQTSACSLAPMAHFQPQPDASQGVGGGGYRPQMQSASCPEEPQTGPEEHLQPPEGSFGGYQPQCSWKQDSPEADGDGGGLDQACLGSPTSVTSSQFLLPYDTSEEGKEHPSSASTWFHNLLTGKP